MASLEKVIINSEEQIRALFDSILIPTYVWQKVGDFFQLIDYNKATYDYSQGAVEKYLGMKATEIYRERPDVLKKLNSCFSSKNTFTLETKYYFKVFKEERDLIVKYVYLPPDLVLVQTDDITERRRAEQKLKESEKKFRTIFEAIPDLYFLISEDTTILDYRGKEQEFYVSPEEFRGKKMVDLIPPYLGTKTIELVKKTIRTQKPQIFEYDLKMKDKVHFYEARYFYISKNQVSIFIRDITKRKNAEKQIIDLAKFPSENPNPVLRVTKENVIYINKSGQILLNLAESSAIPNFFKGQVINAFDDNAVKTLDANFNGQIYSFNIVPIKQEKYANIYGQDITERIKSENALNMEKKFVEDIFNSTGDTIFVFEPETGKAYRWNQVFNEVSGYTDEEISSMKAPDSYFSEEDIKEASNASKIILNEGKTTVEMSLITKDSKKIPYEYTGTSFKNPDGKNLIVAVGRDMTERIEAEEKLKESEKNYRELYEWAPNAYFSIGYNKTLERCNTAAEKLLGYTKEELYKMKVFDLYASTKNGLEKAQELFKQFLAGENIQDQELQMRKKSGENIWISLTVVPILDQAGNVVESRSMVLNINERKEAEQKIKESEEKYRNFIEQTQDGVVLTDENGIIIDWNRGQENIFGLKREDVIGHELWEIQYKALPDNLKSQEGYEQLKKSVMMAIKKGKAPWLNILRELNIQDISGNQHVIQQSAFIIKTIKKNKLGAMTRDITKFKESEIKLRESEKKYQEAFERASFYKDLFAHDINNILQVITSSAELISYQLDGSEELIDIDNIANIIRKQVQRGAKLVRNVRTLSQLDDSESLLESIEGMSVLKNSIKFIQSAFSERNIKVKVDTFANMFSVCANELLQEIFDNILINAVKYNENSPVDIQIKITKKKSENENYIKMEFLDNGIGVQDNEKKFLFKEGYRHLKGSKGMGIGLSLISKILKSYNGKILVEDKVKSDYKKGSNFIVLLPEAN